MKEIKTKNERSEIMDIRKEKEAFKNLMLAVNEMGSITKEDMACSYKKYHKKWDTLIDRMRIYKRVAKLDEKYGLDDEV